MKKRRFSAALLAAVLVVSVFLTGCHGSKNDTPFEIPESFDTSRTYEISFWAKNDTNKTQVAIYRKAIEDFMALYPNIAVNLRLYTDYGNIYNDVITNLSTNTTPNVCITYPDHIATYLMGEDTVVPLDGLFVHKKFGLGGSEVRFDSPTKEEIVPKFLDECRLNGYYYAMPYMRSTEACYVNKTYVEALGFTLPEVLTWDFVWEVSEAALKKDAEGNFLVNGQKVLFPFLYKSTDNMMIQMLNQSSAPYSDNAGNIGIFNEITEEILYTVAEHAKTGAFCTFKIVGYPANFLNAGQCIFAVDSTAGASWMGTDAPLVDIPEEKLVQFETVVMPIPQYDTENLSMISQGPSVCVFNKSDPQEVVASWLFAQYLLTNEVQIAYAQTEGYVPVTTKAQNAEEYKAYLSAAGTDNELHYDVKIKASELLLRHVDETFVTPVFNGSASLRNAAGQLIENTTKSVRRKQTVDEAYIENLYKDISSLYRLDQIEVSEDSAGTEEDLGPLPATAVLLLGMLGGVWVLILLYLLSEQIKKKKKQKNPK